MVQKIPFPQKSIIGYNFYCLYIYIYIYIHTLFQKNQIKDFLKSAMIYESHRSLSNMRQSNGQISKK